MAEELVLASASPARAHILAAAGLDFRVEAAALDEEALKRAFKADGAPVSECAAALAEAKARRISQRHPAALVLGADQILVCGDSWFDKPADGAEARAQLQALRGRTHELVTAACVVAAGEPIWRGLSRPLLRMRDFSDDFLDAYLAAEGTAILGSVGAYRLEGRGIQLFTQVDGDYFAVLGLPLFPLLAFLRNRGALPQ
ncbi:MAG TPA: nucleoside triphosphate pyrophosphatase [Stellaceae bacterium]|nr:nucleoside triphosphate pyrophosphatase [Stellaceae bacterium]